MGKPPTVVRQWTLLRILSQHRTGLSVYEMAQHMGVNERTIRRDINWFVKAGIPLKEIVGYRGKKAWRVDERVSIANLDYSVDEAVAMLVAEKILASCKVAPLHQATRRFRDHIVSGLSSAQRPRFEQRAQAIESHWNHKLDLSDNLAAIENAWHDCMLSWERGINSSEPSPPVNLGNDRAVAPGPMYVTS